jgi:hypothetical protein
VVNPPSGKKDIGFDVAEKPPAQWLNWLLYNTYNWLVWLDAFETEAHTWTQLQTLQRGATLTQATVNTRALRATGNGLGEGALFEGGSGGHGAVGQCFGPANYGLRGIGDPAGAASIGVRGEGGLNGDGGSFVGSGTGYGLRATGGGTSGIGGIFTGTGGLSGLSTTGNGSGWGAFCKGGATGVGVYGQGGATSGYGGDFVGGGTSSAAVRATGGGPNGNAINAIAVGAGLALEATGAAHTSDSFYADVVCRAGTASTNTMRGDYSEFGGVINHPAATASIKHQVRPINTVRAWAMISTNGAGTITLEDGAGVVSVAINGNSIEITFADAFLNNKYACLVSGLDGSVALGTPKFAVYQPNNTTTVAIVTTGSNPATTVLNLDFMAIGRQ